MARVPRLKKRPKTSIAEPSMNSHNKQNRRPNEQPQQPGHRQTHYWYIRSWTTSQNTTSTIQGFRRLSPRRHVNGAIPRYCCIYVYKMRVAPVMLNTQTGWTDENNNYNKNNLLNEAYTSMLPSCCAPVSSVLVLSEPIVKSQVHYRTHHTQGKKLVDETLRVRFSIFAFRFLMFDFHETKQK